MALKIMKLLLERYIYDDKESGLMFDTYPIFPQHYGNDAGKVEQAVNEANKYLENIQPAGKDYKCTIHAVQSGYEALKPREGALADKSYLMLYLPGQDVGNIDVGFWDDYGRDLFIWSSPDRVFSEFGADGLGHRYRVLNQQEREDVLAQVGGSTSGNTGGGSSGGNTTIQNPKNLHITGTTTVNKWGIFKTTYDVDIWVEAEE